ncbi:MAG: hypothetical protein C4532_10855 [Candidatus Abyssobacteria bacterium SURF_17]|uniref:Uncharacterized protein n=1 Tax=Candidatus Abyssobacteria bacterium SURF_17 TaxID=2093361 RepID=A0A419EXR8_9BACT|nr:MAG: hypothetical protein C4532_10855 [Candidatus Abyssubacteria bacterium SURF_17]
MDIDKKIIAAITAGVTGYIQAERAAALAEQVPTARPHGRAVLPTWSRAGREELMRNRQMWQLRIVPK